MLRVASIVLMGSFIFLQGAFAQQRITKPETIAEKKAQLDNTQWAISITAMGDPKAKPEADALSFSEGKVSSQNLSAAGYPAGNFSFKAYDDGSMVWETMQIAEEKGTAVWNGTVKGLTMFGALSIQDKSGAMRDYNFSGSKK